MGQLVLATFADPNGLLNLGNNQWSANSVSGPELIGAPASGSRGVIQSAAVEDSNVDLTQELVAMITAQRNYQANAQTIKTQDQIMQTLINLR
jgi:flagellar hook protein FlgE